MALRYDALKTRGNLQAKLMVSHCLYQAVTSAESYNLPLRELTCHFPPIAELEQWALERVTDVVPQEGDAASRLQSIKIVETPQMVKSTLAKLLGSSEEAAIAAESDGEKGSDSDGIALSDDENTCPLALKVGGTLMFQDEFGPDPPVERRRIRWAALLQRQNVQHPSGLPQRHPLTSLARALSATQILRQMPCFLQ